MRSSFVVMRSIKRSGWRIYGAPALSTWPAWASAAILIARSIVLIALLLPPNGWQLSSFRRYTMERDLDSATAESDCRSDKIQIALNEPGSFW